MPTVVYTSRPLSPKTVTKIQTLIFHARSYNSHNKENFVRSRDYLLPYNPNAGGYGGGSKKATKKRKRPPPTSHQPQEDHPPKEGDKNNYDD